MINTLLDRNIFTEVKIDIFGWGLENKRSEFYQPHSRKNCCKYLVLLFGPRGDEVTGEWRRLHNEELNDLYCSHNIVRVIKLRRMRWAGHVARMGEGRGVDRVLVGKPEGKRPLGRPRHRREDLQEVGYGGMDWIELALYTKVECGNEPSGFIK